MSRAGRYAAIGVIWILAIFCHYLGIIMFAPGTDIYALGAIGVGTFIEPGWRDQMYKVFAQFIPLVFMGGSLIWAFAAEYEQAAVSRRR